MKTLIIIFCLFLSGICYADDMFYGEDGSYLGCSVDKGDDSMIYGSDGSYVGTILRD